MPIVTDPTKELLISIDSYYIEKKRKRGNTVFIFIHSAEELEEWKSKGYTETPDEKSDKVIYKIQTAWRTMKWKEQNIAFSKAIKQSQKPDGSLTENIDPLRYRDMKLKMCLKKWDVKDENNNEVPVTEALIDNLDPTVAQELLSAFEKVTELSDDDFK